MGFLTEEIDRDFTLVPATTTWNSKTFDVHNWNQKMALIKADQQVTVSILYTMQTEKLVEDVSLFYVLTTAKGVTLPANEIIPFGVEDPVHFFKVRILAGLNNTNVEVLVLGSR